MMPAKTQRLFFAIELPREIKKCFRPNHRLDRGIKWTHPKQMHLTLLFLGDVHPDIGKAIGTMSNQLEFEPFFLELADTGFFPSARRPAVFWVGFKPSSELAALHAHLWQVMQCLAEQVCSPGRPGAPPVPVGKLRGFLADPPVGKHAFIPHVTLARIKQRLPRETIQSLPACAQKMIGQRFTVDRFHLFSSQLLRSGAVHTVETTCLSV